MKNKLEPMKKQLSLLFLVLTICFTSKATNYYLSESGNDANNGTSTSSPWKTLGKLNSFFSSLKPGDNVLLNRGDVFYGTIIINKSGSSGSPITIGAYGSGANPVVTGFTTVSSWTNLGGNIWESSSSVSSLSDCNMVAVNGVNTAMGRYPNTGYLTYESASGNTSVSCTALGSTNWVGAEAVIKKLDYVLDRCVIKSQSGSTITYTDQWGKENATTGYGLFIQNDARTLDQQNEWYYNTSTKKIRVYSTSSPNKVQVASETNLLYNSGFDYITIDHVDFTGSSGDAIYFLNSNTDYCHIQNCTISFAGKNGIYLVLGNNCSIDNNVLNDCNSTGIESDAGSNNSITNNTLTNMGVLIGQSVIHNTGIFAASPNVVIKNNSIQNAGYVGIYLNAAVGNGLVQYNFVNNAGLVLDDGGGIYTGGAAQGGGVRTIDHNIVLNTFGSRDGTSVTSRSLSAGIYCDDLSSYVVVTNNSVANSVNVGIKMHRANNCTVNNNTAYNNYRYQVYYQNNSSTTDVYKITMKNNVFFSKTYASSTKYQWVFGIYSGVNDILGFGTLDSNYYSRPINDNNSFDTYEPLTGSINRTLSSWQSFTGLDLHSKISPKSISDTNDLRFEYNVSSSSKTISLGATYIDVKNVSYNGSITLAPYSSAVLIKTGASSNQSPTANAGADQVITLPTNSTTLTGSGTDPDGSISSYSWSKISGPSSGSITSASSASTAVTSLVQGTYQFQLKVTDNAGATDLDTVLVTVSSSSGLLPAASLSSPVNGINYQYYEVSGVTSVPTFSNLAAVKSGSSSTFDISVANRAYGYAINFVGYIYVPADNQYTFYTNSDDGSNLYIDNVLVVNNNGEHAPAEKSGTIGLQAGYHAISVGYFQNLGGTTLSVSYSSSGISKQIIPPSALYITSSNGLLAAVNPANTTNGLDYSYYQASSYSSLPNFSSVTPLKTGTTSNFNTSVASRSYAYAINFTGYINVPSDGQYTFYTNSDDGSNLYIDNILVVSNDYVHPPLEKSGTVGLQAGKHSISVGFFQQLGGAVLDVSYTGPNISKQTIPASALFRVATSGGNTLGLDNNANQLISNSAQVALKAYPNPFLNSVNVSISGGAGKYELILVDVSGKVIWNKTGLKSDGAFEQAINTSALQRGAYFLKVIQNNNTSVIKLVK
jgi:parallel beta-helix repeat protein